MKPIDENAHARVRTLTPEDVSRSPRAQPSLALVLGKGAAQSILEGPRK